MNEEEIKPNLNYLNNFLGYGDSDKARVFHIAIEEKLDPNSDHGKVLSKFISQRDNGEIEILEKTTVHPGTEKLQSKLTYRLITEILEIDIKCSEEEYLQLDFKILRDLEFCSNVNPIACPAEGKWANINTVITGYDSKTKYLIDSWNGTGNFVRIKPRKEVLIEFLTKIKCRMENEKYFFSSKEKTIS
ncbi:MAG: hypothetical protein IPJ45_09375 [Ignavibacteria bacterium]|nr:hypothetical protein [Ignavibacteria bacterium]